MQQPCRHQGIALIVIAAAVICRGAVAANVELPPLKPGLWEVVRMTSAPTRARHAHDGLPRQLDPAGHDARLSAWNDGQGHVFSKSDFKGSGNTFTGDAVCNLGGSTMKSHSVMTLTGNTQYRTVAHATFDPPLAGQAVSDTVIEGRHVGACKPGQQPGDMTLPTGQTLNIRNIMNGKK